MPDLSDEAERVHRAKVELRHELLAHRRSLPAPTLVAAADRVREQLLALLRRRRPSTVTAYVPIGTEPGGADLPDQLRSALDPAAELLLPVLRGDLDLDWATYRGPDELVAVGRGMREPAGPRLGPDQIRRADLVIVPALAVGLDGRRLGRGGGSYDRALARIGPGTLTVALLHDGELVPAVPAQPHDRPVGAVITPAGGLRRLT